MTNAYCKCAHQSVSIEGPYLHLQPLLGHERSEGKECNVVVFLQHANCAKIKKLNELGGIRYVVTYVRTYVRTYQKGKQKMASVLVNDTFQLGLGQLKVTGFFKYQNTTICTTCVQMIYCCVQSKHGLPQRASCRWKTCSAMMSGVF